MATSRRPPDVTGGEPHQIACCRTATAFAEPFSHSASAMMPSSGDGRILELVEFLTPVPEAVPAARRHVTQLLCDWGLSELTDTAALLACELVSNAVKHGSSPVGAAPSGGADVQHIELTVRHHHALFIEVWDPGAKRLHPHVRIAAPHDEVGRGLRLVENMSRTWGHYVPAGGGRTVWCEVGPPHAGAGSR